MFDPPKILPQGGTALCESLREELAVVNSWLRQRSNDFLDLDEVVGPCSDTADSLGGRGRSASDSDTVVPAALAGSEQHECNCQHEGAYPASGGNSLIKYRTVAITAGGMHVGLAHVAMELLQSVGP